MFIKNILKKMTIKIKLNQMNFYAFHGVLSQETKVGNKFVVNLELEAFLEKAVNSDQLKDTINYAEVYQLVLNEMNIPSQLLEHLAGRIIKSLKNNFPNLQNIEIEVIKLNPPFGGDIYSASVYISESYR